MFRELVGRVVDSVRDMVMKQSSLEVMEYRDGNDLMRELVSGLSRAAASLPATPSGSPAGGASKQVDMSDLERADPTDARETSLELLRLFEKVIPREVIRQMAGQEGINAVVGGARKRLRGAMYNKMMKEFGVKAGEEFGVYEYIVTKKDKGVKKEVGRLTSKKDYSLEDSADQKRLMKEFSDIGSWSSGVADGVEFSVKEVSGGGKGPTTSKVLPGKHQMPIPGKELGPERGGLKKSKAKVLGVKVPDVGVFEVEKRRDSVIDPSMTDIFRGIKSGTRQETIDDQIGKMFDYYRKDPLKFVQMLVKVKGGLKEQKEIKGKRKTMEETSPLVSVYLYPKTNKKIEEQAVGDGEVLDKGMSDREKRSIVDVDTLSVFRHYIGKDLPWYMVGKGIKSERGGGEFGDVLRIRFKGVQGLDDEYAVAVPSKVGTIRDRGQDEPYHFRVLDVGEDGVLLQYVEQSKERGEDWVSRIRDGGMTETEVKEVISDMATYYTDHVFSKLSAPEMIQEMGGEVVVAPGLVATPESLGDAVGTLMEERRVTPSGGDAEEDKTVLPGYKAEKEEEIGKTQEALGDDPEVMGMILRDQSKVGPLIQAISERFPDRAVFSPTNLRSIGLEAALKTKSFVQWILTIMADEALKLAKTGKVPWKELVRDTIHDKSDVLLDPDQMRRYFSGAHLNDFFKALKIVEAKDRGVSTPELLEMVDLYHEGKLPVTPEDRQRVLQYLRKASGGEWRTSVMQVYLSDLTKELQDRVIRAAKDDTTIQKFLEQSRLRGDISRGTGDQYQKMVLHYQDQEKKLVQALRSIDDAADSADIIKILGRDVYDDMVSKKILVNFSDPSELEAYKDFDDVTLQEMIDGVLEGYRESYAPKLDKYKAMTYPQIQKRIQEGEKELPEFKRSRVFKEAVQRVYYDRMRDYIERGVGGDDREMREMAIGMVRGRRV